MSLVKIHNEKTRVKKMKKFLAFCGTALMGGALLAAEGGFDASSIVSDATTSVSAVVTAVGSLMGAAIALYVGFVAYRKLREGLNRS